jgi:hypothetical protein
MPELAPTRIRAAATFVAVLASTGTSGPSSARSLDALNRRAIQRVTALDPSGHEAKTYPIPKGVLAGDRYEYGDDDPTAQFFASFASNAVAGASLVLRLVGPGGLVLDEWKHPAEGRAQFSFQLDTRALRIGEHTMAAELEPPGTASKLEFHFTRSHRHSDSTKIPEGGIPIAIDPEPQWGQPIRAAIPIPKGAVHDASDLVLLEDGVPVLSDIHARAAWCPDCGPKWVHVDFVAAPPGIRAHRYRLARKDESPRSAPAQKPISIETSVDRIVVDTHAIRFEVSKKHFAGIERAWVDPRGRGRYELAHPVSGGSAGPYLIDERGIRFEAKNDDGAEVRVEEDESGRARATIIATGWYVSAERRVDPLCMFRTRITAWAGLPEIEVRHETILTYDTRVHRLADLGFDVGQDPGSAAKRWELGVDGRAVRGDLSPSPATVWLHQDRPDRLRIGGGQEEIPGGKSDGWFSIAGEKGRATLFLRDAWQKFPKEVELATRGFTVHFWPKHGHRAFSLEDELELRNIYKLRAFHQHRLLDLDLPNDYDDALLTAPADEIAEKGPDYAIAANGQGLAIDGAFRLRFDGEPSQPDRSIAARAAAFQDLPAAHASPDWNAASGAFGPLAAASKNAAFDEIETTLHDGFISWTRSIERGSDYGMWIYADTHTYWRVKEDRANLHRVWHSSHYHEISTAWLMYFRSGARDVLRWARAATDHFTNVGSINYADPKAPMKFHQEGAMYHCKGFLPWGSEAYGMVRRDAHSGVWGHFVDPDAYLFAWYLDGDPREKDAYARWSRAVAREGAPFAGGGREANTSMAYMVTYYEATWDPWILPSMIGLGAKLAAYAKKLAEDWAPLWHPLWINRYYEHTRDPNYVPIILEWARHPSLSGAWPLALSALAYQISSDPTYLSAHAARVRELPRRIFRSPGDPYEAYGLPPGFLGDDFGYLSFGYYRAAIEKARIPELDRSSNLHSEGKLPLVPSRTEFTAPAGLVVLAHERNDRPFTVAVHARSIVGDRHSFSIRVLSPSGRVLFEKAVPSSSRGYDESFAIAADGEAGVDRIEIRGQELSLSGPLTDLGDEALDLPKDARNRSDRILGSLRAQDERAPITLSIASDSDETPASVHISDAMGRPMLDSSLFRPRPRAEVKLEVNPAEHPYPLAVDIVGRAALTWGGSAPRVLFTPAR